MTELRPSGFIDVTSIRVKEGHLPRTTIIFLLSGIAHKHNKGQATESIKIKYNSSICIEIAVKESKQVSQIAHHTSLNAVCVIVCLLFLFVIRSRELLLCAVEGLSSRLLAILHFAWFIMYWHS